MEKQTIYEVGAPSLNAEAIDFVHSLGYRIGLLADQSEPSLFEGGYDDVIDVNFNLLDDELPGIAAKVQNIAGVICSNERYLVAKAKIARALNLPGPSVFSVQTSLDKVKMHDVISALGPHIVPEYTSATSEQELLSFAARVGYPVILKPHLLTKSPLTSISNNPRELTENFQFMRKQIFRFYNHYRIFEVPKIIAEEYLDGESFSVAIFVDHDGHAHYCSDIMSIRTAKQAGFDDTYLYRRKIPTNVPETIRSEIYGASEIAIKALGLVSTPVRIEFTHTKNGVKIINVAPRTGGFRRRLYELSFGVNLLEQEIRLAVGLVPHPHGQPASYAAAYKLYPTSEGMFIGINGPAAKDAHMANFFVRPTKGQLVGPAKNGYEATALVVFSHPDPVEFHKICRLIEKLTVEVV